MTPKFMSEVLSKKLVLYLRATDLRTLLRHDRS